MYLTINETRYACRKRILTADTVRYLGVEPTPEAVGGIARLFRDDGFLLAEDDLDRYARTSCVGAMLTATNAPEPEPVVPAPPGDEPVTYGALASAIREGVNQV